VRNFGIRLFTLTLCTTALLSAPMIHPAKAGANRSMGAEKTKTKNQGGGSRDVQSQGPIDLRSPTATFPPPMNDDFDRKAGGGAGM
jgi:hypothetical protein